MRNGLFFLVIFAISCSDQPSTDRQSNIDTAKLFNPNNHPDHSGVKEMEMFNRVIILFHPRFHAKLNEKEYVIEDFPELNDFVKANKKEIQKDLLYVFADSNTKFKKIISAIDILKENQITDYKVINVQKYFTLPEPVEIHAPISIEIPQDPNDSTSFSIEFLSNGYIGKTRGQETILKTIGELDDFLAANKSGRKDILIITKKETPQKKFEAVIAALSKNEFHKYNLVIK